MADAAPPAGLRIAIGRTIVSANDVAAVNTAIASYNATARVDGLADTFNPAIIDPTKAQALITALSSLPATKLHPIGKHAVYLNAPGLGVSPASPTTSATLAAVKGIASADVQGDRVLLRLQTQPDCDLARAQAKAARDALKAIEPDVARLDTARRTQSGTEQAATLHDLAAVRQRRHGMAQTWRINAEAVAACMPGDASAKQDLAAATKAAHEASIPSGPGLR
jgi:hypothetical protein